MSMTVEEAIAKFKRTSVLWESASNTEMVEAVKVAIAALEEIQQYRAIGTVSEFRELKEKATAKKPNPYVPDCTSNRFLEFTCPNCEEKVSDILAPTYCNCGQKLLWNRSERLRIHDD